MTEPPLPPVIRSPHPQELPEIARLHRRELTGDFISRFGDRFLTRLYRAFAESPHAEALIAVDGSTGEVIGALVGTLDIPSHNAFLVRHHGPALALHGLARALRYPALGRDVLLTRAGRYLRGIARSLFSGKAGKNPQAKAPEEQVGILAYLMVDGRRRKSGVGVSLVAAYEARAVSGGLDRLELVTFPKQVGAGPFYSRIGWEYAGERTSNSGERFALYTRYLKGEVRRC